MNERPLLTLKIRLLRLQVIYYRLQKGGNGARVVVGTRNWLRPGEYVWRVSLKSLHPKTGKVQRYKVWRSACPSLRVDARRRVLPYVGMEPAAFAWQYLPKRRRK